MLRMLFHDVYKAKRLLVLLVVLCIGIPQLLIYYLSEPRQHRFRIVSEQHDKVFELKIPDTVDGQPSGFNFSKMQQNKVKNRERINNTNMGNDTMKNIHKLKLMWRKTEKNTNLFNDTLPLYKLEPNCTDTYSTYQTTSYCLPVLKRQEYFKQLHGNKFCLREGLDNIVRNGTECQCKVQWHGSACSMHSVVYQSEYPRDTYAYLVTPHPRRVINALPFTHEFDLLEARLHELGDVVDLFIIVEANYTAAGHPRPRRLLNKLNTGFVKQYQSKILYVALGYFPQKGYYNGWVMDALLRNHAAEGLKRVKNLNENDIFVISDADELPKRETILFLKLHDGYPEPIAFNLIHNVYGFYWKGTDLFSHVFGACSIAMLLHFFDWEPYRLRSASHQINKNPKALDHFKYKHGGFVGEWSFGHQAKEIPCGWHCSWCFSPEGIQIKLEGAHWSDLPRWGAFPKKTTLEYIANLTRRGMWFDDITKLVASDSTLSEWYAPQYVKQHYSKYKYLLINPNDVDRTS